MSPIQAVWFDLGGVFLDWDPRYLYRKFFGADTQAMEHFLAVVCPPDWHAEHDRGRAIAQACAERKALYPEYGELIDAWAERAEEMISGVIPGTVEVFDELRSAGVACYALSNMERENWERRYQIYDFLRRFDGYFISALEGVIKPDRAFFEKALTKLGFSGADVFFVDDRQANIEAARACGIDAEVFRNADVLRDDLVKRGLLTRS
jgi:2-haloacid dehalogenase